MTISNACFYCDSLAPLKEAQHAEATARVALEGNPESGEFIAAYSEARKQVNKLLGRD